MAFKYDYERPALTVDCVVFSLDLSAALINVLLIERAQAPFVGRWALPGGFVHRGETLEEAARRELSEETGVADLFLEQLYTFGDPNRDPRGWVVSVAYYALVSPDKYQLQGATDARNARWFALHDLPGLAFDHDLILRSALERLQGKVRYAPIGFELLPRKFTIFQLQRLYETVLERRLDNRNFRKKILGMGILRELDERQSGVAHRAARLYRFDERQYKQLTRKGFNFEL
jgi:8-oxo-dGTP diphosphatase